MGDDVPPPTPPPANQSPAPFSTPPARSPISPLSPHLHRPSGLATDKTQLSFQHAPTLRAQPLLCLRLCAAFVASATASGLRSLALHPATLCAVLPALLAYATAKALDTEHAWLQEFELWVSYTTWWVSLGIVSSIGLGSGLHTGLLFLFPHIFKVCLAVERCGHTQFDLREDVWLRRHAPHCVPLSQEQGASDSDDSSTYGAVVVKVAVSAMLWGIGTAIGEIPPYLFAYAAAQQRSSAGAAGFAAPATAPEEVESPSSLVAWLQARSEQLLVAAVQRHGFLAVLALASWPNALFDFCGLACGQFQMPFWTFFGATLLGKGVIKVAMQCAALVGLFSHRSREVVLAALERAQPQSVPGLVLPQRPGKYVRDFVERGIARFQDEIAASVDAPPVTMSMRLQGLADRGQWAKWLQAMVPDTIKEVWSLIMTAMLLWFGATLVENLAQVRWQQLQARQLAADTGKRA